MQTPISPLSLFPLTCSSPDIENHILSFVATSDLSTCAKVSKAWCSGLDSLNQSYLNLFKIRLKNKFEFISILRCLFEFHNEELDVEERSAKKELKRIAKHFYLGFYANLTLFRIGTQSKEKTSAYTT